MDRITEHQLRVIKVSLLCMGALAVVFYSYEVGAFLIEMRDFGKNLTLTGHFLKSFDPELMVDAGKGHKHQPPPIMSLIATALIFVVLINIGLLVGVAKRCKCLMKIWLAQGIAVCFMGTYLSILNTFGAKTPLYGEGVMMFLGVLYYVFWMGLVWIYHERGEELDTVIRTHRLGSEDDLIPNFNH